MKYVFLALLANEPAHGYELKQAFESTFGAVWPALNAGQIYTTLGRLERDGLVESCQVEQGSRPNKRVYELTAQGREELRRWVDEPAVGTRLKDEFFMKLVLSRLANTADPVELIYRQRGQLLQTLRDLGRTADGLNGHDGDIERLLVEGAALHIQADLRWLDLCEERLSNHQAG